jgi:hypothetical protein
MKVIKHTAWELRKVFTSALDFIVKTVSTEERGEVPNGVESQIGDGKIPLRTTDFDCMQT